MTNLGDPSINCTACDRQYRWKEQYAGKKMKCKCGEVIVMPEEPDGLDDIDDLYGVENAANPQADHCPSCGKRLKPGAVLCIGCGFNLQTGGVVETAVGGPPVEPAATTSTVQPVGGMYANAMASHRRQTQYKSEKNLQKENLKHVQIPLGIIILSMVILFVYMVFLSASPIGPFPAIATILLMTVFVTPVLLVGLYVASSVLGIGYGQLHTGLLKLVAIFLAPEACQSLMDAAMGNSGLIGWVVSLILYYALIMYLFELDPNETFYTIIILAITKFIVTIFISVVIMGMILSGVGGL